MSPRVTVGAVLGVVLVGAILLWAFFGSAPRTAPPTVTRDPTAVKLSDEDIRRIGQPPLASLRNQARDLRGALRVKHDDIAECAEVVRVQGGQNIDRVELTAQYTERDDGRFTIEVIAPALGEVAFDRCVNAVLEPVVVSDDSVETIELDLSPRD